MTRDTVNDQVLYYEHVFLSRNSLHLELSLFHFNNTASSPEPYHLNFSCGLHKKWDVLIEFLLTYNVSHVTTLPFTLTCTLFESVG